MTTRAGGPEALQDGVTVLAEASRCVMPCDQYDETVAVINSNEDTVEMLRYALQGSGFSSVVTGHVHDFKSGSADFAEYLEAHDPDAIVFDVSIPYDKNWTFLRQLLDLEQMRGRKLVVTTTNKRRLDEIVGPTDTFEIVGKPYDINLIVEAVKTALKSRERSG